MNNKIKYIVTCGFKAWGEDNKYPAFGIKYLIEVSLDDEERYEEIFKEKFKEKIGKEFDGDILFVEETELVLI